MWNTRISHHRSKRKQDYQQHAGGTAFYTFCKSIIRGWLTSKLLTFFPSSWSLLPVQQHAIVTQWAQHLHALCVKLLSTFCFLKFWIWLCYSIQTPNNQEIKIVAKCIILKNDFEVVFFLVFFLEKHSDTARVKRVWELTALIRESSTLTAKAVPQANGWVRYSSVSGSSSSSWSRNWTFESFTERGEGGS